MALGIAACAKKDAEPLAEKPPEPAAPTSFALADFNRLRYLEGAWKGTMPNGNAFYESYHFVNDSTILQATHTDSTLQTKSDSARIVFRGGAVIDSGGSAYVAEKLDSGLVDFRAGPSYHFTWTREGDDAWTAKLFNKQPDGTERVTTYPMKRIRK